MRDIEENGGKYFRIEMGEPVDPSAIGIYDSLRDRFQADVVKAVLKYTEANPTKSVPYYVYPTLGKLIDNFVERGGKLPD